MLQLGLVGSHLMYIRSEVSFSYNLNFYHTSQLSFYTSISYTSPSISHLYFHPIPLFQYASFTSSSQSIQTPNQYLRLGPNPLTHKQHIAFNIRYTNHVDGRY